jgi:oxygen-independent coproporphyrinogen-3 oxidase
MADPRPLGIYVHVPFCTLHCPYCDFATYPAGRGRIGEYVAALRREIALIPGRLTPDDYRVETIYLGGGTPSTLGPDRIDQILNSLRALLCVAPAAEITLELNPEDAGKSYLEALAVAGVNRFSLGVQSLLPQVLGFLGRVHTAKQAEQALEHLSAYPNWSVDLMFGWQDQSQGDWQRELERILDYRPPHLSLYQLTLEPQTRFGVLADLRRLQVADSDRQADLYLAAVEQLAGQGLEQYEISNYARVGFRSRHNEAYWQRRPCLGLGPSAASLLWGRRTHNLRSLPRYLQRLRSNCAPLESVELLSSEVERREQIWLGLRTIEGIPRTWLGEESALLLKRSREEGLLSTGPSDRIVLSRKGMAVADEFVPRLLLTVEA